MLKLDIFQAGKGDSFMLTWNEAQTHRLMIDFGNQGTYRFIKAKVKDFGKGDSVIVTHVDYDHIGGFFKWLSDKQSSLSSSASFYMNTPQLVLCPPESDLVGIEHGIELEQFLISKKINCIPLYLVENNKNKIIINGLALTILSPTEKVVKELISQWTANEIYKEYQHRQEEENHKVATKSELLTDIDDIWKNPPAPHNWEKDLLNSSSIAFILEYKESKLLFLGDANPVLICDELKRLGHREDNRLEVDIIKISHHGSKHNTTPELLKLLKCSNYLISTDSSGPYYHPSRETLILIDKYGRPSDQTPLVIYSNYPLKLDKLLSKDEQKSLNFNFKPVLQLTFPLK